MRPVPLRCLGVTAHLPGLANRHRPIFDQLQFPLLLDDGCALLRGYHVHDWIGTGLNNVAGLNANTVMLMGTFVVLKTFI